MLLMGSYMVTALVKASIPMSMDRIINGGLLILRRNTQSRGYLFLQEQDIIVSTVVQHAVEFSTIN